MATPVVEFSILTVGKPDLGQQKPAHVRADVSFSLARFNDNIRREWDSLRPHDVLFLVTLRPTVEGMTSHVDTDHMDPQAFCEHFGIVAVRGCEITTVIGPDGKPLDDFRDAAARKQSYARWHAHDLRTLQSRARAASCPATAL